MTSTKEMYRYHSAQKRSFIEDMGGQEVFKEFIIKLSECCPDKEYDESDECWVKYDHIYDMYVTPYMKRRYATHIDWVGNAVVNYIMKGIVRL